MSKRAGWRFALLLIILVPKAVLSGAAPKESFDQVIDGLFAVREISEVAISPDGKRAAWSEALQGKNHEPSANSAIYVAELGAPSRPPRRITAGTDAVPYSEHDFAWSPDGRQVAFLSDKGKPGQLELYVANAGGGPARKLTNLTGFVSDPSWAPDGKTLALLFTEKAPRAAGPLQPMTVATGVVEDHVYEQRLATVDLATGEVRQVSPADLYVYEYDWSPDGKRLVATAAHGAGDANWYVAELYIIDRASSETKSIYKPSLQIAAPRWSPDGKSIAFVAGLMSDEGNIGGDAFVISAAGGEPRFLSNNLRGSVSWLAWISPVQLMFTEWVDGESGIGTFGLPTGQVNTLWRGAEFISTGGWSFGVSLARDGTCALVRSSFHAPPEVWAGSIGKWTQVTRINKNIHPSWGEAKSLHWPSDGLQIQGWLIYPRDYDPSRRYPLIVEVHGGPGLAIRPSWPQFFFDLTPLSSQGYFVLHPNPRGSFGQGEAFTAANVKDFGYGDFRDILAGVEEVLKTLPVDNNRVALTGWSYGGFMTMWGVTQTNRFKVAVAGAGIANWQSYYGENDIEQWMIPFFGASVYDDPAVYAKSSPITFIKNTKTPTLILVGDRDGECPPPQSFEFWHALKTLGVPNQLVIYPNEGHDVTELAHRRDILKRTTDWLNHYLQ